MAVEQCSEVGVVTASKLRDMGIYVPVRVPGKSWAKTESIVVVRVCMLAERFTHVVIDVQFYDPNLIVRLYTMSGGY